MSDDYWYNGGEVRTVVWKTVQLDPQPEPEPQLVRANPGRWPEMWLPAAWPAERREAWMARWEGRE